MSNINNYNSLTAFLYLLMQEELKAGKVEDLIRKAITFSSGKFLNNELLAEYANNLAKLLEGNEDVKNITGEDDIKPVNKHDEMIRDKLKDPEFIEIIRNATKEAEEHTRKINESRIYKGDLNEPFISCSQDIDDALSHELITEQEAQEMREFVQESISEESTDEGNK